MVDGLHAALAEPVADAAGAAVGLVHEHQRAPQPVRRIQDVGRWAAAVRVPSRAKNGLASAA